MKLFNVVFEKEFNDLSDEALILLNRDNNLSGIPYFALQNVLSKRGLTTYKIIEIDKKRINKESKRFNARRFATGLRWRFLPQAGPGRNVAADNVLF